MLSLEDTEGNTCIAFASHKMFTSDFYSIMIIFPVEILLISSTIGVYEIYAVDTYCKYLAETDWKTASERLTAIARFLQMKNNIFFFIMIKMRRAS